MATALSPSNTDNNDESIPIATLALPSLTAQQPTPPNSRRLPPPCWSPEETTALIQCYTDKWYSLRRGNLRATHWQQVADDVAIKTPVDPTKTSVQCRHKMEKLRKRYRSEIQRSAGLRRFVSTWPHFQLMDDMEKGPNYVASSNNSLVLVNHNNSGGNNNVVGGKNLTPPSSSDEDEGGWGPRGFGSVNNSNGFGTPGVRIKMPGSGSGSGGRIPMPAREFYSSGGGSGGYESSRFGGSSVPNNNTNSYGGVGTSKRFVGRSDVEVPKKRTSGGGDGIGEVVESIRALGEGFMKMEKVKMDMARQVEEMRMEMELKRTEMILESQQRIVEAFASAVSERGAKRAKKMQGGP